MEKNCIAQVSFYFLHIKVTYQKFVNTDFISALHYLEEVILTLPVSFLSAPDVCCDCSILVKAKMFENQNLIQTLKSR